MPPGWSTSQVSSQKQGKTEPATEEELHSDGLIGHLTDLRNSVLKALLAVAAAFFALVSFSEEIYHRFAGPLLAELPDGGALIATGVITPFLVPLKVTFLAAFCVVLPYVLYQAWRFVAPGLYRNERRLVLPLVVTSTLLFYLGMAFAYLLVFRVVFSFIVSFAPDSVAVMPDVQNHLRFAMTVFLTFGLAFEVPVAVFILVRGGVLEIAALRRARPYVIAGAFVTAAIITPPDVISQFMLALPVWLLYEVGILVSLLLPGKPDEEGEEAADGPAKEADEPPAA